jgi:hypothetical protein
MSTLTNTVYVRPKGADDASWEPLSGNTHQLVSGEAVEVVCVGPSKSTRVIFGAAETYYFLVGGMRINAGTDVITVGAPD